MAVYKYYLNDKEYTPINTGGFTFDITLDRDAGAYQYVNSVNGDIQFDKAAYDYILAQGECQKIELRITETCSDGVFDLFLLFFTRRDCKHDPDQKRIGVPPRANSLYQCLKDNYDTKFNLLTPGLPIVSTTYQQDVSQFEFFVAYADVGYLPLWGTRFGNGELSEPLWSFFVRERRSTYCQGGEPQAPPTGGGDPWQLLIDNCEGGGFCTWVRKPIAFAGFTNANSYITQCTMPCAPFVNLPNWVEFWTVIFDYPIQTRFQCWYDANALPVSEVELNNGRLLTDTINYGLTLACPQLGLQSNFLNDIQNPVTGKIPSDTEGIQLHALSDIKTPSASEPATREDVRLKDILEGYISSKLNCFWWVDENTKRLIIEHFSQLQNTDVIDLTDAKYINHTKNRNKFEYDNSNTPVSEEFPSRDSGIDFTGVDIIYKNACASGNKAFNTDRFHSEVEAIISDPDAYGNDGIVVITPDSCVPSNTQNTLGERSEFGAITNIYYPNAPQAMANLQDKYFRDYRPFAGGLMNFKDTAFSKMPVKKPQELKIPICCFFFFNPRSKFINTLFSDGQLQSASFDPKTGFMTLNLMY